MENRKNRVTLKTIAEACGYSVNTVSRALRNDEKLPHQTVERIQEMADELGYIRNRLASSLRSGHTNVIAVLVDNIHNQHYSTVITHMNTILTEQGYDSQVLCCNADMGLERHLMELAVANLVDGVIFFPHTDSLHSVQPLLDNHIPFVLVDREVAGLRADVVRCDDYAGGYLAGEELCRLGHRKFLYLAGLSDVETQTMRESGFLKALSNHGIGRENVRIVSGDNSEAAIMNDTILELLVPVDYTAILSYKDQTAYSAMNSLRMANYRIPEDISMISFDNIRQDIPYLPSLTSIACDSSYHLAKSAVEMLLERIADPSLPDRQNILPVTIHDGGTAARCRREEAHGISEERRKLKMSKAGDEQKRR